jgi:hypothetical protein
MRKTPAEWSSDMAMWHPDDQPATMGSPYLSTGTPTRDPYSVHDPS